MTTEDLIKETIETKKKINDIVVNFRKETGFKISSISIQTPDEKSFCGPEPLPNNIIIDITL